MIKNFLYLPNFIIHLLSTIFYRKRLKIHDITDTYGMGPTTMFKIRRVENQRRCRGVTN